MAIAVARRGTNCWVENREPHDYFGNVKAREERWNDELEKAVQPFTVQFLVPRFKIGESRVSPAEVTVTKEFHDLARKWKEETAGMASPTKRTQNLNYLRIITLGLNAIPLILLEL